MDDKFILGRLIEFCEVVPTDPILNNLILLKMEEECGDYDPDSFVAGAKKGMAILCESVLETYAMLTEDRKEKADEN